MIAADTTKSTACIINPRVRWLQATANDLYVVSEPGWPAIWAPYPAHACRRPCLRSSTQKPVTPARLLALLDLELVAPTRLTTDCSILLCRLVCVQQWEHAAANLYYIHVRAVLLEASLVRAVCARVRCLFPLPAPRLHYCDNRSLAATPALIVALVCRS